MVYEEIIGWLDLKFADEKCKFSIESVVVAEVSCGSCVIEYWRIESFDFRPETIQIQMESIKCGIDLTVFDGKKV